MERPIVYDLDGREYHGFFAAPDGAEKVPCVVIAHAWRGQSEFERDKARRVASELGWAALAYDMYGDGVYVDGSKAGSLMNPLVQNPDELRARFLRAVTVARDQPEVDATRIGAFGFCFGGMCVLELARSGAEVLGVVSFHGLLHTRKPAEPGAVKASILVCHGWDDPMAKPERVVAFGDEMTTAGADWQLHAYGGTMHAFTNPVANAPENGLLYDETADRRSWQAMRNFFETLFH